MTIETPEIILLFRTPTDKTFEPLTPVKRKGAAFGAEPTDRIADAMLFSSNEVTCPTAVTESTVQELLTGALMMLLSRLENINGRVEAAKIR